MSATGRGAERSPADYYPTPAWCVRRILEAVPLPTDGYWLEPSAGDGAIIRAANDVRLGLVWRAWELREECRASLHPLCADLEIGDFLATPIGEIGHHDVAILNPPFTHALAFVQRCLAVADHVLVLERLNWLEGEERAGWLREHAPDVYVLPNRPSFTGEGTDATGYAWLHWPAGGHDRRIGALSVLPTTSVEERNADPRQMRIPGLDEPAQPALDFGAP